MRDRDHLHRLFPLTEGPFTARYIVGWRCRYCDGRWVQLPPIEKRWDCSHNQEVAA